jgi:fatty-acyl-CoA synthase
MKGLMQQFPLTLDLVLRRALELGGTVEVVSRTQDGLDRRTWADVGGRAVLISGVLDSLGVPTGSPVATFGWNSHRHVELMLGVPCAGRVVHPVNVRLLPDQVVQLMAHAGDRALFIDASLTSALAGVAERLPMSAIVVMDDGGEVDPVFGSHPRYEDLLAASSSPAEPVALAEDDAAWICHTSGTTGLPKGVVASHRSAVLHSLSSMTVDSHGVSRRDSVLPATPIFHANAWGLPYTTALACAKLVLPGRDTSAEALATLIESERVTIAAGVPTVFARLVAELDDRYDLTSFRRIMCGGAPVPRSLAAQFVARGIDFFQGWGMTEMSPTGTATLLSPGDVVAGEQGAIVQAGIASAGIELRLVGEQDEVLPWDGDSVGEVEVRGPWVIEAYLDPDDDANVSRFHDGWLRTGDLGRIASDGTLEIVDRAKDLIKSGGEWISSLELERALLLHPDVAEAVVVAIANEVWGERPAAVVVAGAQQPEAGELVEFLRGRVPAWWLPDLVRVVEAIPTTPVGKYDKRRLREQLADELAAREPR